VQTFTLSGKNVHRQSRGESLRKKLEGERKRAYFNNGYAVRGKALYEKKRG